MNNEDVITEHVLLNSSDYEIESDDEDLPDYGQITMYDSALLDLQLGMTVKETRVVEEEFKIHE